MDWYAWLSKTSLDAGLIYEYGLTFVRNELQEEDLPFFNHDFLQSLGISIAKHRLEILKLCRKEVGGRAAGGLSRLVLVMNKTRKLFARNISRLGGGFRKNSARFSPSPYRSQWSGALRRVNAEKGDHKAAAAPGPSNAMWSGPLDRRLQEKLASAGRCQSVSGPLDVKLHERILYPNWSPLVPKSGFVCRSPTVSGPIERLGLSPKVGYYNRSETMGDDRDGPQSLWSIMFQDMKPT